MCILITAKLTMIKKIKACYIFEEICSIILNEVRYLSYIDNNKHLLNWKIVNS